MANQRWQSHKTSGGKTGQQGPRHDTVGPIKTKSWPGIPGKTQPKIRNHGFEKKKQGAAEQGIC